MTSEFLTCAGCGELDGADQGDHCRAFRTAPIAGFCGQHTAVQDALRASPTLQMISLAVFKADLAAFGRGRSAQVRGNPTHNARRTSVNGPVEPSSLVDRGNGDWVMIGRP